MTSDAVLKRELKRHSKGFLSVCEVSRKTQKEQGYNICWTKGKKKTVLSHECSGKHGCILLPECKKSSLQFGTMHTHPNPGNSLPSPGDIMSAWDRDEEAFCVCDAGNRKTEIKDLKSDPYLSTELKELIIQSQKDKMRCYKLNQNPNIKTIFQIEYPKDQLEMILDAEKHPGKDKIYQVIYRVKK